MSAYTTDSPLATRFVAGLGLRRSLLGERVRPPSEVVVHTTGSGPISRFAREGVRKGDLTPFETAVRIYATIMSDSAHYVVGQLGQCVQVVPESIVARHVGSSGAAVYARPGQRWMTPAVAWWGKRWPDFDSPYALAGGKLWTAGSCNGSAIGIEVVPPAEGARGAWSPECWRTLAALALSVCGRYGIPVDQAHIVSHSDAHPLSRSAKGAPWDPGPSQWSWERMREAIAAGG